MTAVDPAEPERLRSLDRHTPTQKLTVTGPVVAVVRVAEPDHARLDFGRLALGATVPVRRAASATSNALSARPIPPEGRPRPPDLDGMVLDQVEVTS
jgi:hypothetical protein